MWRRLIYATCIAAVLGASGTAQAAVFSDNFDTAHDYLTQGTEGTGWDGFIGKGPNQTVNALNASTARPGALYMESNNSFWEGAFSPMGPFLYKVVSGDFIATVRVTDFPGLPGSASGRTDHADSFLMARVANLDDAGPGEDFVATHYFPTWSGNIRRNYDGTTEEEEGVTGDGFNCARYLQLQRTGNVFTFRRSFDGVTWTPLGDDNGTITRDDMDGLAVQVGLGQCMYIGNTGYVAFDDFSVETFVNLKAVLKSPEDKSRVVGVATLEWTGTADVVAHELFFGADPENLESMGIQTETSYLVEQELERGATYYWRVDEVRAKGQITTGDVWSFVAGAPIVATMFPAMESFDQARDFVAQGAAGTFWDGIVGEGAITTADVNHPGQLYLQSANAVWAEPWSPLGPFLYKIVDGDFVATVQVTDYAGTSAAWVYHNNASLMARNVADANAGAGEDWISVDYFPIWNCGNMVRTADDGARAEPRNNGKGWNAYKFLQLERKGNTFTARVSADGQAWEQMGDPFIREDFNDLPVQIGLAQATFSESTGYAAFDNFVLQTNTFQDDFSVAHDFATDGVAGTAYDGLAGDINDVNGVADTSMSRDGQLYLESVNAVWAEPWSPLGPFLYKVVSGNFIATVKVTGYAGDPNNWVYHNSCGLMVRNVADADAGAGEDWVSLDYFPIWSCGNFVRSADDGARTENGHNRQGWNLQPYLQIERVGNTFHFRVSPDGQTWTEMARSPLERKDFDGLAVQVGLQHATFSDSVGFAAFDDFSIVTSQP